MFDHLGLFFKSHFALNYHLYYLEVIWWKYIISHSPSAEISFLFFAHTKRWLISKCARLVELMNFTQWKMSTCQCFIYSLFSVADNGLFNILLGYFLTEKNRCLFLPRGKLKSGVVLFWPLIQYKEHRGLIILACCSSLDHQGCSGVTADTSQTLTLRTSHWWFRLLIWTLCLKEGELPTVPLNRQPPPSYICSTAPGLAAAAVDTEWNSTLVSGRTFPDQH